MFILNKIKIIQKKITSHEKRKKEAIRAAIENKIKINQKKKKQETRSFVIRTNVLICQKHYDFSGTANDFYEDNHL